MRTLYIVSIYSLLSTVTARALLPTEAIASLAQLKPRDGKDDPSAASVKLNYVGCGDKNPKTGNTMQKDISDAWNDAIKLAAGITEIDTATDIGSFDCMSFCYISNLVSIKDKTEY